MSTPGPPQIGRPSASNVVQFSSCPRRPDVVGLKPLAAAQMAIAEPWWRLAEEAFGKPVRFGRHNDSRGQKRVASGRNRCGGPGTGAAFLAARPVALRRAG